jgi:hypothetical protein
MEPDDQRSTFRVQKPSHRPDFVIEGGGSAFLVPIATKNGLAPSQPRCAAGRRRGGLAATGRGLDVGANPLTAGEPRVQRMHGHGRAPKHFRLAVEPLEDRVADSTIDLDPQQIDEVTELAELCAPDVQVELK